MNLAGKQIIYLGTELKLNVNIEPIGGITMDGYNWVAEVYCSPNRPTIIKKENAIRVDENNYILLVDTSICGSGALKCKITAEIPDSDFPDNLRTEVMIVETGVVVVKRS